MEEMTIGFPAFDRLIRMLMQRMDRLEMLVNASRRTFQPVIPTVIDGIEYYDVVALCQIFQVTSKTIFRWRDQGLLPLVQKGRKFYIERERLQEAMAVNIKTEPTR